jgi:hypothetical protein
MEYQSIKPAFELAKGNVTEALKDGKIKSAMNSSLEGYVELVVDSIEFELGRKLSEEEQHQAFIFVESSLNQVRKEDCAELIGAIESWHDNAVSGLQLIMDKREADISLGNAIPDIKAGTETAKGVRIGIILALSLLGELPFSIDEGNDDGD